MSETTTDLKCVSTQDLLDELFVRHDEIMVIREDIKDPDTLQTSIKTEAGKSGNFKVDDYDFAKAMDLLQSATTMITGEYILLMNPPEDDSEGPQD